MRLIIVIIIAALALVSCAKNPGWTYYEGHDYTAGRFKLAEPAKTPCSWKVLDVKSGRYVSKGGALTGQQPMVILPPASSIWTDCGPFTKA